MWGFIEPRTIFSSLKSQSSQQKSSQYTKISGLLQDWHAEKIGEEPLSQKRNQNKNKELPCRTWVLSRALKENKRRYNSRLVWETMCLRVLSHWLCILFFFIGGSTALTSTSWGLLVPATLSISTLFFCKLSTILTSFIMWRSPIHLPVKLNKDYLAVSLNHIGTNLECWAKTGEVILQKTIHEGVTHYYYTWINS